MIRVNNQAGDRISQGDVYKNVEHVEYVIEHDGLIEVSKIIYPYTVVLTQDCDLEQDHLIRINKDSAEDKSLISVLVAPLYNAEHVFSGTHLDQIGIKAEMINKTKTEGRFLLQNQRPRFHYLEFPEDIALVPLIVDFKHYFTVSVGYLLSIRGASFICKVGELFREDLCCRFADYLSRVGLPPV